MQFKLSLPVNEPDPSKCKMVTIRCHPDYNAEGSFHDWVMVKFEQEGDEEATYHFQGDDDEEWTQFYCSDCVPTKVLTVVQDTHAVGDDKYYALTMACQFRDQELCQQATVLTEPWHIELERIPRSNLYKPKLYLVDILTIESACIVVQEQPNLLEMVTTDQREIQESVILIRPRSDWGKQFT